MGAQGSATLDFGSDPEETSVAIVTGQSGIDAGAHVEAFVMRETSSEHGEDEHQWLGANSRIVCGEVVAGSGFDIYVHLLSGYATGEFTVRWVWNN